MKNNFNLRGFLSENKLTQNSKGLKEVREELREEENPHADLVHDILYQIREEGIDPEYVMEEIGQEFGIDFEFGAGQSRVREADLNIGDTIQKMRAKNSDRGSDNSAPSSLGKEVDKGTVEIDGVDSSDYPDFTDAFISYAEFVDGTPLTDQELDILTDEMADEIGDMAYQSLMETKFKSKIKDILNS